MASEESEQAVDKIERINDFPGADVPRKAVRAVIVDQDDIVKVRTEDPAGNTIDTRELVDSNGNVIDPATNSDLLRLIGAMNTSESAINVESFTTLEVEQQTPVSLEDISGTQIDPDQSPDYPNKAQEQDLINTGDLTIGPVSVARSEAILIAANSDDSNTWSASVTWQDTNGNTTQTESKTDISLDSVTDNWARLVRKGQEVSVTFTDESGASNNNINAFVDVHR